MTNRIVEDNREEILLLLRSGKSCRSIAQYFNCNNYYIWNLAKENNINITKRNSNYGKIKNHKNEIINRLNNGESASSIAKILNCSVNSLCKNIANWGIKLETTFDPNNLLKDRADEVFKLFNNGLSCCQIGKKLGFSDPAVWKLLVDNGYEPTNIKYKIDEEFFKIIDTQEKAYVMGMWWSDGNVMPSGKIRIGLHEKDKEILEKIKIVMCWEGPLIYKKPKNERCGAQYELNINRQVLAKQLIELGCPPNKSLILKFPSDNKLPIELRPHFIRGVFDGDGSIDQDHGNVSITGSYDFIYTLKDILPCNYTNIYQRYKEKPIEKSAHTLFIGRKEEANKFLNWIYKDATIYMDRKYALYLKHYS